MSTIAKELFGLSPKYLKLKTKKSLIDLINSDKSYCIGRKVVPSEVWNSGKYKTYFTITKVEMEKVFFGFYKKNLKSAKVYAKETDEGINKKVVLIKKTHQSWKFYNDINDIKLLENIFKKE